MVSSPPRPCIELTGLAPAARKQALEALTAGKLRQLDPPGIEAGLGLPLLAELPERADRERQPGCDRQRGVGPFLDRGAEPRLP
jgi:hypothetical protein